METSRLRLLGPALFYAMHRLCNHVLHDPGDQQYVDASYATEDALAIKTWLSVNKTPSDEVQMTEVPFAPR